MKSKSPKANSVASQNQKGAAQLIPGQQDRAVEQLQFAYLTRRFAPHIVAAITPFVFGAAR